MTYALETQIENLRAQVHRLNNLLAEKDYVIAELLGLPNKLVGDPVKVALQMAFEAGQKSVGYKDEQFTRIDQNFEQWKRKQDEAEHG